MQNPGETEVSVAHTTDNLEKHQAYSPHSGGQSVPAWELGLLRTRKQTSARPISARLRNDLQKTYKHPAALARCTAALYGAAATHQDQLPGHQQVTQAAGGWAVTKELAHHAEPTRVAVAGPWRSPYVTCGAVPEARAGFRECYNMRRALQGSSLTQIM